MQILFTLIKQRYVIWISVLLLVFFVLLSKYEDRTMVRDFDFSVTVKVQERIDKSTRLRVSSVVANVMEGATFFASPEFTVIATLVISSVVFYDPKKKRWGELRAVLIPIALVLLVVTEVYGKSIVHHPAPAFGMIKNPTSIFPADYVNEQFSYPSGHAARAVFLAVSAWWFVVRRGLHRRSMRVSAALFLTGYVGIVSVSRVYLGHHWFSDVVGGLLVGTGMGLVPIAAFFRQRITAAS